MIFINNNYINTSMYTNNDEQSYIENILRLNRGKNVEIYMSFAD